MAFTDIWLVPCDLYCHNCDIMKLTESRFKWNLIFEFLKVSKFLKSFHFSFIHQKLFIVLILFMILTVYTYIIIIKIFLIM